MSIVAESLAPGVPGVLVVELPEHVEGHDLRPALPPKMMAGEDCSAVVPATY
jgi:hypothetical protein